MWMAYCNKTLDEESLKGKSTDFENIYQNVTFFKDITNMWIKNLKALPIKSYDHIFGIKVNPSLLFGGAIFLVSYFFPSEILQLLYELGVISSFFGGQVKFVSCVIIPRVKVYLTPKNEEITPNLWRNCKIRGGEKYETRKVAPPQKWKRIYFYSKDMLIAFYRKTFENFNSHILNVLKKCKILIYVFKNSGLPL